MKWSDAWAFGDRDAKRMVAAERKRRGWLSDQQSWAEGLGLSMSNRNRCLCGLTGKYSTIDVVHSDLERELIDHPSLYLRDRYPAVLVTHLYDTPEGARRLAEEARRFVPDLRFWIGESDHPVSFWKIGVTIPVLYSIRFNPEDFAAAVKPKRASAPRRAGG